MRLTVPELQADLEALLDRVLETGEPLEIERRGRVLRVIPAEPNGWVDRLVVRDGVIVGDPEDLVHVDWSGAWKAGSPPRRRG